VLGLLELFKYSTMTVIPLFPSTLCVLELDPRVLPELDLVKTREFRPTDRGLSSVTLDYSVLDSLPGVRANVISLWTGFKDLTLGYADTDFRISRSWATRCSTGQESHFHTHKNAFYSGVVYLDTCEDSGALEISDQGSRPGSYQLNRPRAINQHNSSAFFVQPVRGMMVLFPSYLMHRIRPWEGAEDRYSLAFNIIPVGNYGHDDSQVDSSDGALEYKYRARP
jgi:hypothetical protein